MARPSDIDGRGGPKAARQLPRHGHRAQKTPPICKATIRLVCTGPGPFIADGDAVGRRSQRQTSFAIPPPGAGVRGVRLPIWDDGRRSITSTNSRGGDISHQTQPKMETTVLHQSALRG